jgi:hypothetical protein
VRNLEREIAHLCRKTAAPCGRKKPNRLVEPGDLHGLLAPGSSNPKSPSRWPNPAP